MENAGISVSGEGCRWKGTGDGIEVVATWWVREVCYNRTTSPKRRLNAKNLHRDQFLLAVRPFSEQNFKGKHKKQMFDHHVTNHEKPENILVSTKNYNNILHCNTFKTCALNSEYLVTSSSDMSGFALFFLPAYLNTDVRALRPKS